MKHFVKFFSGINVGKAYKELLDNEVLWNADNFRTTFEGSPFKECDDIVLRFQEAFPPIDGDHECVNRAEMFLLPECQKLIRWLMAEVGCTRLGRVLISRMEPGKEILPHEDSPQHAAYYDRYHIVLNGKPGSTFYCMEESTDMLTGEVWWFNNALMHSVKNTSEEERIHIIVDMKGFE